MTVVRLADHAGHRRGNPLAALTGRELEILALMAAGCSNQAIRELLVLSPKTVESHVRHILRKLDLPASEAVHRRVQAVLIYLEWAREQTATA